MFLPLSDCSLLFSVLCFPVLWKRVLHSQESICFVLCNFSLLNQISSRSRTTPDKLYWRNNIVEKKKIEERKKGSTGFSTLFIINQKLNLVITAISLNTCSNGTEISGSTFIWKALRSCCFCSLLSIWWSHHHRGVKLLRND